MDDEDDYERKMKYGMVPIRYKQITVGAVSIQVVVVHDELLTSFPYTPLKRLRYTLRLLIAVRSCSPDTTTRTSARISCACRKVLRKLCSKIESFIIGHWALNIECVSTKFSTCRDCATAFWNVDTWALKCATVVAYGSVTLSIRGCSLTCTHTFTHILVVHPSPAVNAEMLCLELQTPMDRHYEHTQNMKSQTWTRQSNPRKFQKSAQDRAQSQENNLARSHCTKNTAKKSSSVWTLPFEVLDQWKGTRDHLCSLLKFGTYTWVTCNLWKGTEKPACKHVTNSPVFTHGSHDTSPLHWCWSIHAHKVLPFD